MALWQTRPWLTCEARVVWLRSSIIDISRRCVPVDLYAGAQPHGTPPGYPGAPSRAGGTSRVIQTPLIISQS